MRGEKRRRGEAKRREKNRREESKDEMQIVASSANNYKMYAGVATIGRKTGI